MMPVSLTKEKFEEYMAMLKQGKIDIAELKAGLIAVHGSIPIEGAMTPLEFLNFIGVPLDQVDMSDELRRELEEELRKSKQ